MTMSGYHEKRHGGIQVPPWDGLIFNHSPSACFEQDIQDVRDEEKQKTLRTEADVKEAPSSAGDVQEEVNRSVKRPRISRKCLWILIAVLLMIVTAAIGGAIGGVLAEKKKASTTSVEQQPSTSATPSSTISGEKSATSTAIRPSNTVDWGQDKAIELGCYIDDSDRLFRGLNFSDALAMSPQLCAGLCSQYKYFGLENAKRCFCGNVLTPGYSQTLYSDCDLPCPGKADANCGNLFRIDVYQLTAAHPPVKSHKALGCYADGTPRTLAGPEYQNQWMTTQLCAGLCNDYTYFGVEYGDQCFCGDEYDTSATLASGCTYLCAGNSSQTCGGDYAIELYHFD